MAVEVEVVAVLELVSSSLLVLLALVLMVKPAFRFLVPLTATADDRAPSPDGSHVFSVQMTTYKLEEMLYVTTTE